MIPASRCIPFVTAAIVVVGCRSFDPVWIARSGVAAGAEGDASDACAKSEPPINWERTQGSCCLQVPSIVRADQVPATPDCKPPVAAAGQVALLACLDGDPASVTGIHRMKDGTTALLANRELVCGGMVRASSTALWVVVPAAERFTLAMCDQRSESCSGPPRP